MWGVWRGPFVRLPSDRACGSVGKVAHVSAVVSLVFVTPLRSAHDSMQVGASGHYGELWSAWGGRYGDLCFLARQFYKQRRVLEHEVVDTLNVALEGSNVVPGRKIGFFHIFLGYNEDHLGHSQV